MIFQNRVQRYGIFSTLTSVRAQKFVSAPPILDFLMYLTEFKCGVRSFLDSRSSIKPSKRKNVKEGNERIFFMKRRLFLLLLTLVAAVSYAQERKISGTLIDRDTKEPLPQVTLQLLTTDSAFVGGAVSDEDGKFTITAPKNDKYLLKISSVGYITTLKRIEMVEDHDLAMG